MVDYRLIPPDDDLKDVISHLWTASWDVGLQESNSTYYVVANSLTEITFGFKRSGPHDTLQFSTAQGQTSRPAQVPVNGFCHLIGVSLYSYAIPGLFRIPASELNHEFIALENLLGKDGNILSEKMALARTTPERLNILQGYFRSLRCDWSSGDELVLQAIHRIQVCRGDVRIADLAAGFNLSQKQFTRRFKAFAGFTPKVYGRIIRFESFLDNYPHWNNLTAAAHESGYFDQAHFIHEFKSLSGFSPNKFFALSDASS